MNQTATATLNAPSFDRRLQFEELISRLSASLVNLPPEEVELEIENGLKLIGEFLNVDRVLLLSHTNDGKNIDISFCWLSPELQLSSDLQTRYKIIPSRNTPALHEKLSKGEICFFKTEHDIPKNWTTLQKYFQKAGLKSSLILPLKVGGNLIGGIGMDFIRKHSDFPQDILERLQFVADVYSNALSRKKSEQIFQKTMTELYQLKQQLEADCYYLQDEIKSVHNFEEIIGESDVIKKILFSVEQVAPTKASVLILGETGTGKELIARAVHNAGPRKDRPMIKVNCAALPPNLVESMLFGHNKGAFTGADFNLQGRFELAHRGTLFLDEIAELPFELQPKILRAIQEGEFERLGSTKTQRVDVRIIAATNRDLETEIREGRFRKDLWYRLNVFPIVIPPLRDRVGDIPLLASQLTRKYSRKHGKNIMAISRATMTAMKKYPWPGNVRELENVIERAIILSRSDRLLVDLPDNPTLALNEDFRLEEIERKHITMVLEKAKWRIAGPSGAAHQLGLHPNTLHSKMKKLGIKKPWQ